MIKEKRWFLVVLFALAICLLSVVQLNKTLFVAKLLQGVFAIAILLLIFLEIFIAIRSKSKILTLQNGKILLWYLFGVLLIPTTSYLMQTDGGKIIKIKARASGPLVYADLNLYADNTFKLLHSGPVAGAYYRGAYVLSNDTLILESERLRYLNPTLTFVLRDGVSNKKYFEPVIHQDPSEIHFTLDVVNRKFQVFDY